MNFRTSTKTFAFAGLFAALAILNACSSDSGTSAQQQSAPAEEAAAPVTPPPPPPEVKPQPAPEPPAPPAAAPEATTEQGEAKASVDAGLPDYSKASGVAGNLSSVGSDTLANLMTLWAEEFKRQYPNVNIQIQAAGSSTAPPALVEGTANLGPMSRAMKDGEIQAFEEKHGYKPTAIRVAIDALAVYVHKDNPMESLSIPQVDAIFSSTRKCGYVEDIIGWGQLGLTDGWTNRSIQLFGRNSVSGTYGYFKQVSLCKGDFKNNVNEQPGSASVVQSVSTSLNGIGYSGIGYKTSGVKALGIAKKEGEAPIPATKEKAGTGEYPLARFLYVYVNKAPNKPLPPLEKEFIKMVLSKVGQVVVVKDGYVPINKALADRELSKLD